jgi:hypothetical protein
MFQRLDEYTEQRIAVGIVVAARQERHRRIAAISGEPAFRPADC